MDGTTARTGSARGTTMSASYLASYLNDHLAGSEVALELLEHLQQARAGEPIAAFAAALREDIAADRRELEALMGRLGIAISRTRAVGAWLSEKMTRLKMRLDDASDGALRQLEVLDAVSVGIEGKRLLWRSLGTVAASSPEIAATDLGRLERRAEDQRTAVESWRLESAREALGLPAPVAGA